MYIPEVIDAKERLVRIIFTPQHIKNGKVISGAFKPPPDDQDVSVLRLDYTTPDFCKNQGRRMEKPSLKTYCGLSVVFCFEAIELNASVIYSPISDNEIQLPMHADIRIGCIAKRGEPLPAQYNYMIKCLAEKARYYNDPSPNSETWEGEQLN